MLFVKQCKDSVFFLFFGIFVVIFFVAVENVLAGGINHCVASALPIVVGNVYRRVGLDAKFCNPPLFVEDGAGRESHSPAVGQGAAQRHPAAATCLIAQNEHVGKLAHKHYKMVGCAEYAAVGEHHGGAQPYCAVAAFKIQGARRR